MVGALIGGKYQIVRRIGAGGMGTVYEALHTGTGRRVAVKVIAGSGVSAVAVERFEREARAAAAIDNAHVVEMLDIGHDARLGCPFMVMEYLHGEDLHQVVSRLGPLRPALALRIAAQACAGLARAHESGVVHRDIKPANVFLARRDAGEVVVKLLDFGIAKVRENALASGGVGLTRTGSVIGSPGYMSPEQAIGAKDIDERTDVWSLGVVLYEMLAGRAPWHHVRGIGELIAAIATEPPLPIRQRAPWVPSAVASIVMGALAPRVAERTPSAVAMLHALSALLPGGRSLNEAALTAMTAHERVSFAARLPLSVVAPAAPAAPGVTTLLDGLGGSASRAAAFGANDRTAGVDSLLAGFSVGAASAEPQSVRPVAIPVPSPASARPAARTLPSSVTRPMNARPSRALPVVAIATVAMIAIAGTVTLAVALHRERAHAAIGAHAVAMASQMMRESLPAVPSATP